MTGDDLRLARNWLKMSAYDMAARLWPGTKRKTGRVRLRRMESGARMVSPAVENRIHDLIAELKGLPRRQ